MQFLDRVRVISDDYEKYGIKRGDEGHILNAEIRFGRFNFYREDPDTLEDAEGIAVKIADLELVKSAYASDEDILADLPQNNPEWGCKVIDGFILNLKGEKLNKTAFNYQY